MAIVWKFSDYQKHILRRIISMKAIYINMDMHNYDYKKDILSEPILLLCWDKFNYLKRNFANTEF